MFAKLNYGLIIKSAVKGVSSFFKLIRCHAYANGACKEADESKYEANNADNETSNCHTVAGAGKNGLHSAL